MKRAEMILRNKDAKLLLLDDDDIFLLSLVRDFRRSFPIDAVVGQGRSLLFVDSYFNLYLLNPL